ncbi:DeoR/GlpR family DNA-binding transcription regulator [Verrucomicrobium sp. GAS474]|uniref:DeoR/GlpR family DNA-binding transcription regulator n=1 Tax=Verrucomicrobium sp. GAS474 TaxID=1882831 RepID=UPI0013905408|nr:DeoR/GlpR family DNA-binding transcription regulator [Verrucomicrobium sp. GAS474]
MAKHLVEARRDRVAQLLRQHRYLPLQELCDQLSISEATARRDLAALADAKKVTRTYGGALSDYNETFTSFSERRNLSRAAKKQIAASAVALLKPGMTCYLDAGTTMLFFAEALRERPVHPLKIVTNNLLVAETLAGVPELEVHLLGGLLLRRQSVLLGEQARKNVAAWRFDVVFLGAEGMTGEGVFNSQKDVVEFQKAVAARAKRVVLCLDGAKLGRQAAAFLLPWSGVDRLLTDAAPAALRKHGIAPKAVASPSSS